MVVAEPGSIAGITVKADPIPRIFKILTGARVLANARLCGLRRYRKGRFSATMSHGWNDVAIEARNSFRSACSFSFADLLGGPPFWSNTLRRGVVSSI
jgi:hypothetical protein